MKKLFIYYSLTGNGDVVADYFKKNNYSIRKVETNEKLPKNYILSIIIGGFKALIGYKDNLKDFDISISKYNKIVIGSPVWNNRLSTPINSVLDKLDLSGKDISFVLYSGSGKFKNKILTERYGEIKIVNLVEPKKNRKEFNKLEELL